MTRQLIITSLDDGTFLLEDRFADTDPDNEERLRVEGVTGSCYDSSLWFNVVEWGLGSGGLRAVGGEMYRSEALANALCKVGYSIVNQDYLPHDWDSDEPCKLAKITELNV